MSRGLRWLRRPSGRFPRVSGDEPRNVLEIHQEAMFSPRERG